MLIRDRDQEWRRPSDEASPPLTAASSCKRGQGHLADAATVRINGREIRIDKGMTSLFLPRGVE